VAHPSPVHQPTRTLTYEIQYALPAGGLRGWAITDLRGANNDAAGSSITHLPASENRQYEFLTGVKGVSVYGGCERVSVGAAMVDSLLR